MEYGDLFKLPLNLYAHDNYAQFERIYNEQYTKAESTDKVCGYIVCMYNVMCVYSIYV